MNLIQQYIIENPLESLVIFMFLPTILGFILYKIRKYRKDKQKGTDGGKDVK